METPIIVALIAAAVAITGWFVVDRLNRRREENKEERERVQAARVQIQNVFSACNRRALFTRTHAQLDHDAMFSSLDACRAKLQEIEPNIEAEDHQQIVSEIISQLDSIARLQKEVAAGQVQLYDAYDPINQVKLNIIGLLKKLSKRSGVPYNLPPSPTEEVFFTLEDANEPPNSQTTSG